MQRARTRNRGFVARCRPGSGSGIPSRQTNALVQEHLRAPHLGAAQAEYAISLELALKALTCVADHGVRREAKQTLRCLITGNHGPVFHDKLSKVSRTYEDRMSDWGHSFFAFVPFITSFFALVCAWPWGVSFGAIICSWLYLILLILSAAIRPQGSDRSKSIFTRPYLGKKEAKQAHTVEPFLGLPNVLPAMIILVFVFFTFVFAFGRLYIASEHVFQNGAKLTEPFDAAYFSLMTLTTVGYGDYVPFGQFARLASMGEVLCGATLLLAGFPILASRLAMFQE